MVQCQMLIGELADRLGIPTSTVRYYERTGLIPEPARSESGYRSYDDAGLARVGFIRDSQASGLTLNQIRTILEVRDRGETPCQHVRQLIDVRLAEVEERITALEATRAELNQLRRRARSFEDTSCDEAAICGIVRRG